MARRGRRVAALVLATTALAACGDDESAARGSSARCAHDVLESDLRGDPLAGPGVDPATGKLRLAPGQRVVVSSTYGVPHRGPNGAVTQRYGEVIGAVQQQLMQEKGLLAISLSSSEACGSGRTLAIWRSEEEMYDFVTSPAHLTAMKEADELLQPGYAVTHWDATSLEQTTLDEAVRQLHKVAVSR